MAKTNLLEFAQSFKVSRNCAATYSGSRSDDYASSSQIFDFKLLKSSDMEDVKKFEGLVIDKICGWSDWKSCPESELLAAFFKNRNKLVDTAPFYKNIEKIKLHNHYRGCDIVYSYAKNVLKGRLPSGVEGNFLKEMWKNHYGSRAIYKYAKYVIRNRLPVEYEKDCNALDYLNFIELKGYDISEVLINSTTLSFYYYRNYCYLPEVVHNYMLAMQLSGDHYANIYFKQRKKDDRLLKGRLKMFDPNKTVGEVLQGIK